MVSHVRCISGKKKKIKFVNCLTVDINVCIMKCVTGKNVILHKALAVVKQVVSIQKPTYMYKCVCNT